MNNHNSFSKNRKEYLTYNVYFSAININILPDYLVVLTDVKAEEFGLGNQI